MALVPVRQVMEMVVARLEASRPEQALRAVWESCSPWRSDRVWPSALRGGVLTLGAAAPVFSHEVTLRRMEIIRRLNEAMGRAMIKEVRVRLEPKR
ncbi:MAG: DciA family protein [bacterium]